MIEASKMPLPVADSQLKLKTAPSAVGFTTTGGTRSTSLSRPATAIFGKEIRSRKALVCGKPQTKATTLRIIHGSQALRIADCEPALQPGCPSGDAALRLSVLKENFCAGCPLR